STFRWGRSAAMMRLMHALRGSAIAQALQKPPPPRSEQAGENLMDVVLDDAQIPSDDPRRAAAARNLKDDITWILDRCRAHDVPVIVCTCPGSERNLAPIGEDTPPPLNEAERTQFDDLLARGRSNVTLQPEKALADLNAAAQIYNQHATLHYLRAQCLERLGHAAEATTAYRRARDLDTMPWRAPSTSNEAIRSAAQQNAVLCDLEREFQQASPDGTIGWELMDDHVHPALAGQLLIARALGRAMAKLPGKLHVDPAAWAALPDDAAYLARQGANPLDAYRVIYRVTDLFERSFFKRSNPDALTRFEAERRRLENTMSPLTRATIRRLQDTHSGVPITGAVGEAELLARRADEAAAHLDFARRSAAPFTFLRARYGCLELAALDLSSPRADADAQVDELLQTSRVARRLAGQATPLLDVLEACALSHAGRHEEAIALAEPVIRQLRDPMLPFFAGRLVTDLVAVGRVDDARALLQNLHLTPAQVPLDDATSARLGEAD
ncbi:MAG TPA: hypothetical protein P5572_17750, partial [Phycisphaerae bacterium]|nr:hypothetical protein [Phycisphaerae bacterium]